MSESVDWAELERLHTAFACTYHPITEDNPEYDRLCGALARSFPAILAERREMLAKLEAQERALQNCLYATSRKAYRETALADAVRRFCKDGGVEP